MQKNAHSPLRKMVKMTLFEKGTSLTIVIPKPSCLLFNFARLLFSKNLNVFYCLGVRTDICMKERVKFFT